MENLKWLRICSSESFVTWQSFILKFGTPERDSIPFDSGIILQWDLNPNKLRQKATQLGAMNKTYVLEVRYIDESWKCSLHISGQFKQLSLIKRLKLS